MRDNLSARLGGNVGTHMFHNSRNHLHGTYNEETGILRNLRFNSKREDLKIRE